MSDVCVEQRADCFGFGFCGVCNVCDDTNFKDKPCPFYKTSYVRYKEHTATVEKLKQQGRYDLIQKYGRNDNQSRLWGEIIG